MPKNQMPGKTALRGDLSNPNCASREVFEHIMGRWGGLILRALLQEKVLRFAELRDSVVGISEKVLSQNLKHFERDGLLNRKSYDEVPPRVEYSLTPVGITLAQRIKAVCETIEVETLSIKEHQTQFDKADRSISWHVPRRVECSESE